MNSAIYLLEFSDSIKGDIIIYEEIKKSPKLKQVILNAQIIEISGDKFVNSLKYQDRQTGQISELAVQGVFVEIGLVPNSEMVKNLVQIDKYGQVMV